MSKNPIKKILRSGEGKKLKVLEDLVPDINELEPEMRSLSDEELQAKTGEFRQRIEQGESINELLIEAFAVVREAAWRVIGQRHYDVQLIGGAALHFGWVAEMRTGEGKTLTSTLPIYLNTLAGKGVHVVTVNDYLATRDAEWMGQIYRWLGLEVGLVVPGNRDTAHKRIQYEADVTYGTNNELGFDYLRDNMALQRDEKVQRGHAFAVVDEVDSVLIDEARTPLIISGTIDAPVDETFTTLKPGVQQLVKRQSSLVSDLVREAQKFLDDGDEDNAGLKLLQAQRGMPKNRQVMKVFQEPGMLKLAQDIESIYTRDKKMQEVDDDLYFAVDEKSHVMDITEKGRSLLSPDDPDTFIIPDLGELLLEIDERDDLSPVDKEQEREKAHQLHAERSGTIHNFNQLLRAFTLYEKDVEYVLQEGKVMIVDEFTGRVLPGRRYSDGLHQALEAKENVRIERETQTLATITIQNYFRLYDKLSGMTGTAETEAEELGSIYGLDVTVIPTHRPISRDDRDDLVYKTKREKYNAAIDEITECHHSGQPTLVGTISVEVSELLSRMLKRKNIPHNVLNAKQHKSEAEVVARAGQKGAVTIATNMAGRGTDIKLAEGIKELGGLHIIGTERHESRRIDLQLRGRSGRQGDDGSSRFYLSLEDDLMRLFSSDRVAAIMDRMGIEEGEVISARMVTRAISNAQKKVEVRNFGIRKHLLEYDDVMNQQRQVVYDIRNQALAGENMQEGVFQILDDFILDEVELQSDSGNVEYWDWDHLKQRFASHLMVDVSLENIYEDMGKNDLTGEEIGDWVLEQSKSVYKARETLVPENVIREFERFVILRTIDEKWKDHLYAMDQLREGINLRAYGQKNPLLEYKSEGFKMFQEMMADMNSITVQRLFRTQIQGMEGQAPRSDSSVRNVKVSHQDTTGMGFQGQAQTQQGNQPQQVRTPIKTELKVGRNEKILVRGPNGDEIEIKNKKLQNYLNKGYTQV